MVIPPWFVISNLITFERHGSGHFFLTGDDSSPSAIPAHDTPRIEAGLLFLTDFFLCNKRRLKGYCALGIGGL
jgi:hypothetical protein